MVGTARARLCPAYSFVLPRALGVVHRRVGAAQCLLGRLVRGRERHAGAEGDDGTQLIVQEEAPRQLALQPRQRGDRLRQLGIGQQELSALADVGINTVKRVEQSVELSGSVRTLWKIQSALERAGVEFIPSDEHKGPGVRFKNRPSTKPKRAGRRVG